MINSKLTVNLHPECFAGSVAGRGCLWAFLTLPGLFSYSCHAWRPNTKITKATKNIRNTTPDWLRLLMKHLTQRHNRRQRRTTKRGWITDHELLLHTEKNTWHNNPKTGICFSATPWRIALTQRSISIIAGACLPSWIVGVNGSSSHALSAASCWH